VSLFTVALITNNVVDPACPTFTALFPNILLLLTAYKRLSILNTCPSHVFVCLDIVCIYIVVKLVSVDNFSDFYAKTYQGLNIKLRKNVNSW